MTKISDRKLIVPNGVSLNYKDNLLEVIGPQGQLKRNIPNQIILSFENDNGVKSVLTSLSEISSSRARRKNFPLVGTLNSIIFSMIKGVSNLYERELEVKGVGYKVNLNSNSNCLEFTLGHSHLKKLVIPSTVSVVCRGTSSLVVKSNDKQQLGWFCSLIKSLRSRTPYKMKGIYDKGEVVNLKSGKSVNK